MDARTPRLGRSEQCARTRAPRTSPCLAVRSTRTGNGGRLPTTLWPRIGAAGTALTGGAGATAPERYATGSYDPPKQCQLTFRMSHVLGLTMSAFHPLQTLGASAPLKRRSDYSSG